MIAPLEPPSENTQASQRVGLVDGDSLARQLDSRPAKSNDWGHAKLSAIQRRLGKLTAQNPVAAVAMAAVIGLAVGWVTKRRSP